MTNDDGELVRKWQSGDVSAFEALVRVWQGPIALFLARMLGTQAPVADLCQETFLRLYLHRSRYRESGTFSSWLYRIAVNLARDWLRRRQREPQSLTEDVTALHHPSWENDELCQVVEAGLAALPPALREVLVLRHYEQMNFQAMSQLLSIPTSTLKSRFSVALRQMRQHLKARGWSEEEATS